MKKILGSFNVTSGKVVISDPCYSEIKERSAINGLWKSYVNLNGEGRVTSLVAEYQGLVDAGAKWLRDRPEGVDSGQMSVFDSSFYRKDAEGKGKISKSWEYMEDDKDDGAFYGACCTLTCGESNGVGTPGGVLEHGVVSQTGYGDGSYPVFLKFSGTHKRIVAIKVKFI